MNARDRRVNAELDSLYAELPDMKCQGFCHSSCGPIRMTLAEYRRTAAAGVAIKPGSFIENGPSDCVALTAFRQCSIYDIRPLICRLWGMTRRMQCNYGCRPSRWLSDQEVYGYLARAYEISGEPEQAALARAGADPRNAGLLKQANVQIDAETDLAIQRAMRRERGTP